jgi:hypothetical protein
MGEYACVISNCQPLKKIGRHRTDSFDGRRDNRLRVLRQGNQKLSSQVAKVLELTTVSSPLH